MTKLTSHPLLILGAVAVVFVYFFYIRKQEDPVKDFCERNPQLAAMSDIKCPPKKPGTKPATTPVTPAPKQPGNKADNTKPTTTDPKPGNRDMSAAEECGIVYRFWGIPCNKPK